MICLRLHSQGRTEPGFGIVFELYSSGAGRILLLCSLGRNVYIWRVCVPVHAYIKARGKPLVAPSVVIYFSLGIGPLTG